MRIRGIGLALVMAATAFGQWTHTIDTVAGGGFPPDGSTAISTGLGAVAGVAVDGGGRVFFSLSDFHVVLRLDPDGTITRVAGNGSYGYSGDDGPAASAQLAKPAGIALDRDGNLYIAEIQSRRVRKVSGGTITTVAGNGTAGFSGDNGPATAAQFFSPQAVAVDSAGNLYIADTGNRRIRKVSGGTITTFAGNGAGGSECDNGTETEAQLLIPKGLDVN